MFQGSQMSICKMRGENHKPLLHKGLGSVNHKELLRVNNKKRTQLKLGKSWKGTVLKRREINYQNTGRQRQSVSTC